MCKFFSSRYWRIYLVLLLVSSSWPLLAQQPQDYAVQANIIYHFTKYIDWPDNKKSGDFIIAVVGSSPLYDELKKDIAGKMVGDQKIRIQKFSASATSFDCHILFISEDESENMKRIASITKDAFTLLVSEEEGLAKKGSCINFIIVSDHLKLEINKNNIENRKLNIASELLQLGKIVK
jgi:YfiR/HmsC-like